MSSITLGQYFPGNSLLHRLDPRFKIVLAILYITASFLCKNIWSFAALAISAVVLVLVSRIPVSIVLRGLRPILFIMLFTVVLNIFLTRGETLLVEFWVIRIYLEGILTAVSMVLRITVIIVGTGMFLTYTTTPIALTDGIERLLSPLKVFHLPVHEFAMMMTIALRFIPLLIEETEKIMAAQKARGADFSTGSLLQRAKALIPILVPLFVSAFRRADELAVAMECRCYRGGEGRTRMTVLHATAADWLMLAAVVLFGVSLVLINRFAPGFTL
ncbi:MAG: energy-coupling factor transporter transmembrane protein EcfT [Ruminococcaceae bacterium]|nr:energy-coupling factor transporter transmembrane protein EcfT [Oscillospiraceae bacterium]